MGGCSAIATGNGSRWNAHWKFQNNECRVPSGGKREAAVRWGQASHLTLTCMPPAKPHTACSSALPLAVCHLPFAACRLPLGRWALHFMTYCCCWRIAMQRRVWFWLSAACLRKPKQSIPKRNEMKSAKADSAQSHFENSPASPPSTQSTSGPCEFLCKMLNY